MSEAGIPRLFNSKRPAPLFEIDRAGPLNPLQSLHRSAFCGRLAENVFRKIGQGKSGNH
jgi:hypothetical protein